MYWFLVQFCILLSLLIFSTLVTWYEGSAILENPWEWKYSAPFSELFHGEVKSEVQISQLDYFVYAAKFHPVFPTVMLISIIYIILLLGYRFFKDRINKLTLYLSFWGFTYLAICFFIINSPTSGGRIFTFMYMISGILFLSLAAFTYLTNYYNSPTKEV